MHTETPNLTFNKCIYQTTRTGGEISHKEYGYREVREADDNTTTKRTQTNETVERRGQQMLKANLDGAITFMNEHTKGGNRC